MVKANKGNLIGSWAFLIGVIIAVLLGLFGAKMGAGSTTLVTILVVVGLIVGLCNVADKEVTPFLFSGAVLIIAGGMGSQLMANVPFVNSILAALLAIFVPATIIVAVKNVFALARR